MASLAAWLRQRCKFWKRSADVAWFWSETEDGQRAPPPARLYEGGVLLYALHVRGVPMWMRRQCRLSSRGERVLLQVKCQEAPQPECFVSIRDHKGEK